MNKARLLPRLFGLVLAGGKSTRMKKDKAVLNYHGKPQTEYAYKFLSQYCEKVFLSNRSEQKDSVGYQGLAQIHDLKQFSGIGPLGGILSAMSNYPEAAWLVLACDLPYVGEETIQHLINFRDPQKIATAYQSSYNQLPEPLCAIYEPHGFKKILELFHQGIHCPRKILIQSDVVLIESRDKVDLDNINHPGEYILALQKLKNRMELDAE